MSIENTLDERQKTHGEFKEQASISQALRDIVRAQDNYGKLEDYQREALDMIMHKVARILNGNPNFSDHWHDIAGYATLVEKELSKGEDKPLPNSEEIEKDMPFNSYVEHFENMLESLNNQEDSINRRLDKMREIMSLGFGRPAEYNELEDTLLKIRAKRYVCIDELNRLKKVNKNEDWIEDSVKEEE